jgi:16S rRNA (guanine966-N2)-methyltransferase
VEQDRTALEILRRNVARFSVQDRVDVRSHAVEHSRPPEQPVDLLFMDPPYGKGLPQMTLERLADPAWIVPRGWVSAETSGEDVEVPNSFSLEVHRRFGKAHILLLRRA